MKTTTKTNKTTKTAKTNTNVISKIIAKITEEQTRMLLDVIADSKCETVEETSVEISVKE